MNISIFTGCVIPIRYPGMEAAARFLAPRLGIELTDVRFGCCPSPTGLKEVHFDAWLALAARNLCLAEERGLDLVTLCAGCTHTLRETNYILTRDEKKRLFVHGMLSRLGKAYRGSMKIYHLPDLLARDELLDRLEQEVVRPLSGMRVGIHYGCHYFRPASIMNSSFLNNSVADTGSMNNIAVRNPPRVLPESMEFILESLGAEVVEYNRQDLCCGAALNINAGRNEESLLIAREKLGWMHEAGIEALAVACPACFAQFDVGQLILCRRDPAMRTFPVFHIAELVALALGAAPEALNLRDHKIQPVFPVL